MTRQALIKGARSDEWYTPEWCVKQIFNYYKPTVLLLPIESLGGLRRHKAYRCTKLNIYIYT